MSSSRKLPDALRAEHLVLPEHHPIVPHLVLTGRKVPVPEERELLFERPRRRQHPVRPPEAEPLRLEIVRGQAVEELVDDRLEPARRAFWQDLDSESLSPGPGNANGFGTARRKGIHSRIPDSRLVEWFQTARVDRLVVHEPIHRLLRCHAGEAGDLFRGAAKAAALEKMGCAVVIPIDRRDRRQIINP